MGSRTTPRKLMGSMEPIEPMLTEPLYRVVKRNCQVAKLHCSEHLNENMVENSSPTCKHNLFALIQSKKMFVKCPGM